MANGQWTPAQLMLLECIRMSPKRVQGLRQDEFVGLTGRSWKRVGQTLDTLLANRLIYEHGDAYKLTSKGYTATNYVLES